MVQTINFLTVMLPRYFILFPLDLNIWIEFLLCYQQGPDFDDMSSFFPCEIDNSIQFINLGYGAQAPYCIVHFSSFGVVFKFYVIF